MTVHKVLMFPSKADCYKPASLVTECCAAACNASCPALQLELFDAMRYKFDPGNPDYLVLIGEQNRRTLALNARELSRNPQVTCCLSGSSCRASPQSCGLPPSSKASRVQATL